MKILVAPNAFKEALSAKDAGEAIKGGLLKALPNSDITVLPIADGGDGTIEVLVEATKGQFIEKEATGPLGERIKAKFGILGDGKTAVIEMARSSGLALVPKDKRNPAITTTYGVGELIREALDRGAKRILVGIGGSATNDGGAGMAQALGAKLLDKEGKELPFGGLALKELASIDMSNFHPLAKECEVIVMADVKNPLCGPEGASYVYGPQKGGTKELIEELDKALFNFAQIVKRDLGKDILNLPGSGAAGGLGGGLVAFLNAQLRPGIDVVLETLKIEEKLEGIDLVISGEGKIDGQTIFGKGPAGIAKKAKERSIPVILLGGAVDEDAEVLIKEGLVDALFSITKGPITLEDSIRHTRDQLEWISYQIGSLIKALT
ncbi:MAG: glycerate kinase [bacterium]|nr:glycerate kinase [bacterium]